MYQARVPLILMFEGWDAAGKGGAIKRVAQALDARAYTIFPSPAPTKPETCPPPPVALLDAPSQGGARGHLRPQLVRTRAGGARGGLRHRRASGARAYDGDQRVRAGAGALGRRAAEVLGGRRARKSSWRRFRARQEDPAKQWKITDEDWRNRDKYPQYKSAVEDMFRLDVHAVRAVDRCWNPTTSASPASRRLKPSTMRLRCGCTASEGAVVLA